MKVYMYLTELLQSTSNLLVNDPIVKDISFQVE